MTTALTTFQQTQVCKASTRDRARPELGPAMAEDDIRHVDIDLDAGEKRRASPISAPNEDQDTPSP